MSTMALLNAPPFEEKHIPNIRIYDKPDTRSLQMKFSSLTDSTTEPLSSRFLRADHLKKLQIFVKCAV